MDHRTRLAVSKFQSQNGLPRTATLDQQTFNRLSGGQGLGVGSSTPSTQNNLNMNQPNTGTTSMNPPPANTPAPSNAGNTNTQGSTTPGKIGSPKQP